MSDEQESTQTPVVIEPSGPDLGAQKAGEEVPVQQPKSTKYCANCGAKIDKNAAMCTSCGALQGKKPVGKNDKFCTNCGSKIDINAEICPKCGVRQAGSAGEKNPVIAGILSFLIVGLGQVYAGKPKRGIVLFIASVVFALLSWLMIPVLLVLACWLVGIYDAYVLAQGEPGPFRFIDRYTNEL